MLLVSMRLKLRMLVMLELTYMVFYGDKNLKSDNNIEDDITDDDTKGDTTQDGH